MWDSMLWLTQSRWTDLEHTFDQPTMSKEKENNVFVFSYD